MEKNVHGQFGKPLLGFKTRELEKTNDCELKTIFGKIYE